MLLYEALQDQNMQCQQGYDMALPYIPQIYGMGTVYTDKPSVVVYILGVGYDR